MQAMLTSEISEEDVKNGADKGKGMRVMDNIVNRVDINAQLNKKMRENELLTRPGPGICDIENCFFDCAGVPVTSAIIGTCCVVYHSNLAVRFVTLISNYSVVEAN